MQKPRHTIWKARTIALVSGLVLAGVVVATAAIPWLRTSNLPDTVVSTAGLGSRSGSDPASATESTHLEPVEPSANSDVTEHHRLVGTWRLEKHGQRTITILPDGTARAAVQLDFMGSLLYGEKLSMELTWSVEDEVMTQTVTGGEPAEAVARLIRDWGAERRYHIVEVNEKRLVLAELEDDADRDVWTAVEESSPGDQSVSTPE